MRISKEALFNVLSTRFGLQIVENSIENPHFIFCSSFPNLRLGEHKLVTKDSIRIKPPLLDSHLAEREDILAHPHPLVRRTFFFRMGGGGTPFLFRCIECSVMPGATLRSTFCFNAGSRCCCVVQDGVTTHSNCLKRSPSFISTCMR
jgi:hypothetical protein